MRTGLFSTHHKSGSAVYEMDGGGGVHPAPRLGGHLVLQRKGLSSFQPKESQQKNVSEISVITIHFNVSEISVITINFSYNHKW